MSARRLLLAAAIGALGLAGLPAGAQAAANHPFLGVMGTASYEDACGLAYGPGGTYLSDYYHDKVELPGGGAISPQSQGSGPCKLAFDNSGDLYVYDWHQQVVKYDSGELRAGAETVIDAPSGPGTEVPTGLAVDKQTGEVYVAHRTYVSVYDSTGTLIQTIGSDPSAEYFGAAVSEYPATAGYLYVPDAATNTVAVFDATGTPLEELGGEATPQGRFTYLRDSEALIDNNPTSPSYGHLYVLDEIGHGTSDRPEGALDEFNAQGDYRGQVKGFGDAEPSGIAVEAASGNVLVTSGNSEGSGIFKYGPTAPAKLLKVSKAGAGGGRVTSNPVGIACGGACAAEFSEGERVTLFANPDGHSRLAGWSVSGAEPCPGAGTCTVLMTHNTEVSASFEEPTQETLTVSTTGTGEGTVTSEPAGIECPSACSEHFAQNRIVTLTATPGPHSRFLEWAGLACEESTQRTCQVTMSQAEAMSAKFEAIPQKTLTVAIAGNGEGTVKSSPEGIWCPPSCSGPFDEGSTVALSEVAAPGSAFAGWGGACAGEAPLCEVAMTQAQLASASFSSLAGTPGAQAFGVSPPAAGSAASLSAAGAGGQGAVEKRHHRHRHHHRKKRQRRRG